jgi:hypothetical protein
MKMKPAANLQERVKDINERIDVLNTNQTHADSAMERNYLTLSHQIKTLRTAFPELGDNFLSELKGMREEMTIDFRTDIDATNRRLSDLGEEVHGLREDGNRTASLLQSLD